MDKISILSTILQGNPADSFARYGLAMEFVSHSRIPEALAEFNKVIAQNPDYVPAYQMSAQTMSTQGDTAGAIARLHSGIAAAIRTGNDHARDEMEALREDLTSR